MPPNPLARPFAPPVIPAATTPSPQNAGKISSTSTPTASNIPSLPVLSSFLQSHLPQLSPLGSASEVPWLYHSPLPPRPRPKQAPATGHQYQSTPRPLPSNSSVQKLVLSITPTEGVYTALGAAPLPPPLDQTSNDAVSEPIAHSAPAQSVVPSRTTKNAKCSTAAFIHRPWTLTRGRLPRGTTVWSSHKAFDEGLTTGCNLALMAKLGTDVEGERTKILVGYKGDEGRRIGLVAGFAGREVEVDDVRERVRKEFGDLEGEGAWFGFDRERETNINDGSVDDGIDGSLKSACNSITAIACMNAFHPAEVDRVAAAAVESGFASSPDDCSGVLYLTGAVREEGLQDALQKKMKVVCVGHRICEVWGVAFLAEKVKERWPDMRVEVVDEEEMKPAPKPKKEANPVNRAVKASLTASGQNRKQEAVLREGDETRPKVSAKRKKSREDDEEDGGVAL